MAKFPKVSGAIPVAGKQPRVGPTIGITGVPVWRMGRIDFGGPWCPKTLTQGALLEIIEKLKDFERSTWVDIERRGSHFIEINKITADARHRLQQLKLEDTGELFSLRLTGEKRIWGLRSNDVLSFLWWDPDHQVCPAPHKHT